jgi:16S rRNA (uracil1498-N3)-methyltransferase
MPDTLSCEPVLLDQEESHHLFRVLRLKEGDEIELFDGTGALYTGTIDQIGKQVTVNPVSKIKSPAEEDNSSLIVCQGDLKGGKMDFLVEKCTELGVDRFIPFSAGRSQGRIAESRREQRLHRRMSIVQKACKQSGRLRFMQVDQDMSYDELLDTDFSSSHRKLILWEEAGDLTLAEAIGGQNVDAVCLMIGPEGGFSDEEVSQAHKSGWQAVSLGDLILRAETATISAVSITNHLLGNM